MFRTFVINLDKDRDRLVFMDEQLSGLGIDYHRQSAVLGREYKPGLDEYDPVLAKREGGHDLLPGEIGCALSHAQVINKIVEEKIPYTLVLEDDVLLPKKFKEIIEFEITKNGSWEYLLFDYVPVGPSFLRSWFRGIFVNYKKVEGFGLKINFIFRHAAKAVYIIPMSLFEFLRNYLRRFFPGPVIFFRPVYFAGAYLVSYEGAKKMHSLINPVRYTADQLPNKARVLRGLKFRCYSPLVVSQQKSVFGSSILNLTGSQLE